MNVALATACGSGKYDRPCAARYLYKSPRIKHLESWCRDHDIPFYILSAEYGLISGDQVIAPYQRVMDLERSTELVPQVADTLKQFNALVFFKAGARPAYATCVRSAARLSGCPVVLIGSRSMEHVDDAKRIAITLRSDLTRVPKAGSMDSLELVGFADDGIA